MQEKAVPKDMQERRIRDLEKQIEDTKSFYLARIKTLEAGNVPRSGMPAKKKTKREV